EIREEFRTGSGSSNAGGNPTPVTIHTWLERFNKQKPHSFEKATAPIDAENWISHMEKIFDVMGCENEFKTRLAVANAARNFEILHERDGEDTERPDKRQRSGDRHQPTSQQSSHRSHGHHNDRQGSDRRGGIPVRYLFMDMLCFVLFDTGATHSVISSTFTSRITTTPTLLDHVLCISTPMQGSKTMLRSTVIPIELSLVIFMHLSIPITVPYWGKSMQIISALQVRTLLYHGCEGFLATIHDTTSEIPSIHDQPIVSEFPDVFPDELPGIPQVCEVEFNIKLIPGAEPISKAPYRMAPVELKE
nr:hypothetical protein [Tanacetum cinerariifolium]